MPKKDYPQTPDGRYFVSKGRLWRRTDPRLPEPERRAAVKALFEAIEQDQIDRGVLSEAS